MELSEESGKVIQVKQILEIFGKLLAQIKNCVKELRVTKIDK